MVAKKKPDPAERPDEEVDENGTHWTANSYTLANGEGETFGPNHARVPVKVLGLRARSHPVPRQDGRDHEDEGLLQQGDSSSSTT